MTTTKLVYVIAAIVPFGFVALGVLAIAHAIYQHRRYRIIAERAGMIAPTRPMLVY